MSLLSIPVFAFVSSAKSADYLEMVQSCFSNNSVNQLKSENRELIDSSINEKKVLIKEEFLEIDDMLKEGEINRHEALRWEAEAKLRADEQIQFFQTEYNGDYEIRETF